jgi:hypothetical protein
VRWEDERYIRWYTRNNPEWCVLPWQTRGLWGLILREVDRAGILDLGKLGLPAIAVAVRAPWEEIEPNVYRLLDDGCLRHREDLHLVIAPNFVDAQEAAQSDRARAKSSRERARDIARAKELGVDLSGAPHVVTKRDTSSRNVTLMSQNVTVPSRNVSRASHDAEACDERFQNGEIRTSPEPAPEDVPDDLGAPIVTKRDAAITKRDETSRNERKCHEVGVSRHSTPSYAVLRRAEPNRDGPGESARAAPQNISDPVRPKTPPEAPAAPSNGAHPAPSEKGSRETGFVPPLAETPPADQKLEGDALTLEREIARHRVFAGLDARTLARRQVENMLTSGQRLAWVIASVETCAAKNESLGMQARELQRTLVEFMRRARESDVRAPAAHSGPPVRPEAFDFKRYGKQ